tara:strand:+ start:19 stop:510 length:492 start_codon:yes stop_codon:yes gene_type:complete
MVFHLLVVVQVQEEIQIATRLEVVAQEEVQVTIQELVLHTDKVIHHQFHPHKVKMVEVIALILVVLMRQQLVVEQEQQEEHLLQTMLEEQVELVVLWLNHFLVQQHQVMVLLVQFLLQDISLEAEEAEAVFLLLTQVDQLQVDLEVQEAVVKEVVIQLQVDQV